MPLFGIAFEAMRLDRNPRDSGALCQRPFWPHKASQAGLRSRLPSAFLALLLVLSTGALRSEVEAEDSGPVPKASVGAPSTESPWAELEAELRDLEIELNRRQVTTLVGGGAKVEAGFDHEQVAFRLARLASELGEHLRMAASADPLAPSEELASSLGRLRQLEGRFEERSEEHSGVETIRGGTGQIAGRVTDDPSGAPIDDTSVRVYDSFGKWAASGRSNSQGDYTTGPVLAAGDYFVSTDNSTAHLEQLYDQFPCRKGDCHKTLGTPVSVSEGNTTIVDFELELGGQIAGAITEAATGLPLDNQCVVVTRNDGEFSGGHCQIGASSYFTSGLESGTYFVSTNNSFQLLDELYSGLPCPQPSCDLLQGTPIQVTQGVVTTGIDFSLEPGGVVMGTITASDTASPIDANSVQLFDASGRFIDTMNVVADGTFVSRGGLDTGDYLAKTRNDRQYFDELWDNILCIDGRCDETLGTPFAVTEGETTNLDFILDPGGAFSGTVTDELTAAPLTVSVYIYDESGDRVGRGRGPGDGTYISGSGLPTGNYYAKTAGFLSNHVDEDNGGALCPAGCNPAGGTPIAVTVGSTTPNIDFQLGIGGSVAGRLTDASNGAPVRYAIALIFDAGGNYYADAYGVEEDGFYETGSGLLAGDYHVLTFANRDYAEELYDDLPCDPLCDPTPGTIVPVVVGATTSGIDFALLLEAIFADGFESGTLSAWSSSVP